MFCRIHHPLSFLALTATSLGAFLVLYTSWTVAAAEINSFSKSIIFSPFNNTHSVAVTPVVPRTKTPRQTVKGLYLTAYSTGNPKKVDEIIRLIDSTELNAVVIDIKDYTGYVLYDSQVPLVQKYKTKKVLVKNLIDVIQKFHDHNIYVVARQTVFQDPVLAEQAPAMALKDKRGGLWRDNKGLAWVDASNEAVWKYNIAIAREAVGLGFDEINFDYVRFPSDGNMSQVKFSSSTGKKYKVMSAFYDRLSKELANEPVWLSLDMFGFVMEKHGEDDMNIGQRLSDALNTSDYICPMMYPSHYPPGHLGFANPADHPGQVIENGLRIGMAQFTSTTRAQVRPWIQAFSIGAVYDSTKIRQQIDAVDKYTDAGWLMWNASNRYTAAGLKSEVASVATSTLP